jgi:hypothetical protein
MNSATTAAVVVGVLVVVLLVVVTSVLICRRRRRLMAHFGLDAHERRFKRRLDRQMQEIDDIFDDGGGDDGIELNAAEIEQLQLLEQELAKRAHGVYLPMFTGRPCIARIFNQFYPRVPLCRAKGCDG